MSTVIKKMYDGPVEVTEKVRVDDVTWGEISRFKRFRTYVQALAPGVSANAHDVVFFKELGDPRIISRKSGQVWPSEEAMHTADPDDESHRGSADALFL